MFKTFKFISNTIPFTLGTVLQSKKIGKYGWPIFIKVLGFIILVPHTALPPNNALYHVEIVSKQKQARSKIF